MRKVRSGESDGDGVVDLAARGEVRAERLFEREPDLFPGQPGAGQPGNDRLEQAWRGRQEDRDALGGVDALGEPVEMTGWAAPCYPVRPSGSTARCR